MSSCRRHEWGDDLRCVRPDCGAVYRRDLVRRGRNSGKRGRRTSHDLAEYLGGVDVERKNLPWDVEACGARIQSKRLAVRPSLAHICQLIDYMSGDTSLRAVYYVGARQHLTSGSIFCLLEDWISEHGWKLPESHIHLEPSGTALIEMSPRTFLDIRGSVVR